MTCQNHAKWALSTTIIIMACSTITLFSITVLGITFLIPIIVVPAVLTAYLPDIDTKKSKSRGLVMKILVLSTVCITIPSLLIFIVEKSTKGVASFNLLLPLVITTVLVMIIVRLKHRRETHSIFLTTVLFILVILTCWNLCSSSILLRSILLGMYIGVQVHIITDMMTTRGAPILYPLSKKYFKLPVQIKDKKNSKVMENSITNLVLGSSISVALVIACINVIILISR